MSTSNMRTYDLEELTLLDINDLIDKGVRFKLKSSFNLNLNKGGSQSECAVNTPEDGSSREDVGQ